MPRLRPRVSIAAAVALCAETECSSRFLRDEPHKARLDHPPSGLGRQIPHLDDVRLLFARSAGFHPHLHGDADHHVSCAEMQFGLPEDARVHINKPLASVLRQPHSE